MSIETQIEREEQAIEESYERGEISRKEMEAELRELQRDYQAAAETAAQEAYDAEYARW